MSTLREQAIEAGWAALEAADADGTVNTLGDVRVILEAVLPLAVPTLGAPNG